MTTPTGVPVIDCNQCGYRHPVVREHCAVCGLASLFGHEQCAATTEPEQLDLLAHLEETS